MTTQLRKKPLSLWEWMCIMGLIVVVAMIIGVISAGRDVDKSPRKDQPTITQTIPDD